jgi:hypothetical protein
MYTKVTQSNVSSSHVHKLITITPGKGEELDTVLRCATCGRIMLMEHDEEMGGTMTDHQCPPISLN